MVGFHLTDPRFSTDSSRFCTRQILEYALRELRRFVPLAGSAQLSRFTITQPRDKLSIGKDCSSMKCVGLFEQQRKPRLNTVALSTLSHEHTWATKKWTKNKKSETQEKKLKKNRKGRKLFAIPQPSSSHDSVWRHAEVQRRLTFATLGTDSSPKDRPPPQGINNSAILRKAEIGISVRVRVGVFWYGKDQGWVMNRKTKWFWQCWRSYLAAFVRARSMSEVGAGIRTRPIKCEHTVTHYCFIHTVKPALSDHREQRPPAFNDRFFVHRQFHTETALRPPALRDQRPGFFVHRRPVFPCVEQPGDDPKPPFCEVPQQKFDGKPRSAQAEKPTSALSRFERCLCSLWFFIFPVTSFVVRVSHCFNVLNLWLETTCLQRPLLFAPRGGRFGQVSLHTVCKPTVCVSTLYRYFVIKTKKTGFQDCSTPT